MEFQIGDKVKLSKHGLDFLKRGIKGTKLRGTVVGFSLDRKCARISPDDNPKHYTESYHKSFLEKTAVGAK